MPEIFAQFSTTGEIITQYLYKYKFLKINFRTEGFTIDTFLRFYKATFSLSAN